ncbi:MAG: S8 family serine peptidase [Anaerolineales bacterium]|nr:S8 family serine peptidase [Anaerolineales bacterium]
MTTIPWTITAGTHVAGIVAASGAITGVAPSANLWGFKVLSAGGYGYDSTVIAGVERAADLDGDPLTVDPADVANMSLGGFGDPDDPMSQAVDAAVNAGVVMAVAAGNWGPTAGSISSPGTARNAITVAASDKQDLIARFSSRGPIEGFESVLKPDITAPGVAITSTIPGQKYDAYSGTSMAAPHVAGAAALIKQLHLVGPPPDQRQPDEYRARSRRVDLSPGQRATAGCQSRRGRNPRDACREFVWPCRYR